MGMRWRKYRKYGDFGFMNCGIWKKYGDLDSGIFKYGILYLEIIRYRDSDFLQ